MIKKTLFLSLALLTVSLVSVFAQNEDKTDYTLQFVDARGNVIADGSIVTVNTKEVDPFSDEAKISTGLFVKNSKNVEVYASTSISLTAIPNGHLDCCFPSVCTSTTATGDKVTAAGSVGANATLDFNTEWFAASSTSYGTATAVFQILYNGTTYRNGRPRPSSEIIGYGPKVTVNFVNSDPTGISSVKSGGDSDDKAVEVYNLSGVRLQHIGHGVNIIRYANGTMMKVIR